MIELINGRTPEEIKKALGLCPHFGCKSFEECAYEDETGCPNNLMIDALALIERLESKLDAAILDLKAISHCYTCSNRDLDDNWVCKNSGGGGGPFMQCPGYVWDKKLPEPPEEDA